MSKAADKIIQPSILIELQTSIVGWSPSSIAPGHVHVAVVFHALDDFETWAAGIRNVICTGSFNRHIRKHHLRQQQAVVIRRAARLGAQQHLDDR